ncbi:PilN domain-containing protein [Metallibacterium scheffleri]|nr:PilN domain-containing protein [Metallibacterium scheffleri]
MVHLFDELVKRTPPSVRLTSMAQKGEQLTLEGVAQSNAAVADYMRNLEASPWLGAADLQKTEKKAGDSRMPYDFGLTVKLGMPKNAGAAAATSSLASLPIPVVPGAPAGAGMARSPAHAAISAPPAAAASHAGSIKPGAQP